jgi:hypothetical protein
MNPCIFEQHDDVCKCKICGRTYRAADCTKLFATCKGPGDYLHDAIVRLTGKTPTETCSCRDHIRQMNAWGPSTCIEHIDEIVDWLIAEAKKRNWWHLAVAMPGSRFFIKRMVLWAIHKAEPESISESSCLPCHRS